MTRAIAADHISYEDLYMRWEHGNWRAMEIDFSTDREQWHGKLSEIERRGALWTYSMFFHGEDSVTDNLSPFIDAAPREEQKYFLATQQADEARHAVMFGRFMREVVGAGSGTAELLEATRPELTWGFRRVFSRLDRMAQELRKDRSRPKLAQAVTLYHLVIEASLAQPGQHFIDGALGERELLPGLRAGVGHVSRDEQRHIAFGVKLIADLIREDPDCEPAIEELLREVLPITAAVFVPPGWDERLVTCFGFTLEDIFAYGTESLERRLRAAGLDPERMRLGLPFDVPSDERARRALALLRAGYLGPRNGHLQASPELTGLMFDSLRRQLNPELMPGATVQWDFTDAEPWHLRIDNGATSVIRGRAEHADLTFRCRLEDWIDVTAGRAGPWRALLTGRMRPSGNVRLLMRAGKLFA